MEGLEGQVAVILGDVIDAAKLYNSRRKYSHNVPHKYIRNEGNAHYVVAEYRYPCCKNIPVEFTRHLNHCNTAIHIATMYGVDRVEVLRTARRLRVLEALEQA